MQNVEGNIQMLKHRSLAATAATFFFLLAGVASADVAGSYKLAVGSRTPCSLTLAADGSATGDCVNVAKWSPTPSGLTLLSANSTVVGVLTAKGNGYEGHTADLAHKIVLSH
jgi:hypothetical protein